MQLHPFISIFNYMCMLGEKVVYIYRYPWRLEEGVRSPGELKQAGVISTCLMLVLEPNIGSLEQQ